MAILHFFLVAYAEIERYRGDIFGGIGVLIIFFPFLKRNMMLIQVKLDSIVVSEHLFPS